MIKGYKLVYSPTSSKRFRYKVKIKGDDIDCRNLIKGIGPICGRPFKSIDSDFTKAFYVYGSSTEAKNQITEVIDGYVNKLPAHEAAGQTTPPPPDGFAGPGRSKEIAPPEPPSPAVAVKSVEKAGAPQHIFSPLKQKYTFETLYEGGFNRFLKQACENIARDFDSSYNPLFIWGRVGRGKTHLIQAIGNFIKEKYADKTVVYMQAQDLMDRIQKVKDSPAEKAALVDILSDADAMLIDDIQFMEGDTTQDVFFSIF